MQNKKKFIIAIILFIFLGLTIYTFANPADDQIKEQGSGNGESDAVFEEPKEDPTGNNTNTNVNETLQTVVNDHGVRTDLITIVDNQGTDDNEGTNEEEDDTYAKALAAVILAESKLESESYESALELVNSVTNNEQQTELNDRLTEVKNAIDVKGLVATLYAKTTEAQNRADMDDARDFRTLEEIVSKVSSLTNETLKDELETTLEELSKLLDDLDEPKFNFDNGKIAPNFTIEVEDENFDYMTITNMKTGETITVTTTEYELPSEGADNLRFDIIAYDKAKNETKKVNIYIDNTNPLFEGKGIVGSKEETLVNNGVYKKVTLNVTDGSLKKVVRVNEAEEEILTELDDNYNTAKVMSYENTFDTEGTYTIKAIDRAGNETEITFVIDTTKPVISNVENGKHYNTDVTPNIEDANFKNATLKLDGKAIKSYKVGDTLTKEGTYTLVATDKAMNKTNTITFVIDKTAPEVTLYMKGKKVETDKFYTATLKAVIEDANEYTAILKDHNGKEIEYISGSEITGRANYTLEVTDKAGNTSIVKFGIDKDYPLVYLNGTKNEKVKTDVKYYNKDVEVKVTDLNLDSVVLTKDNEEITFENNSTITEEGNYIILATDKAGNKTQVNFVIDKTLPEIDKVQVYNISNANSNYVKNGEMVRILATFKDELSNLPILKISDETVEFTKIAGGNGEIIYSAYLTIPTDESKLVEGSLEFNIVGYKDLAGNIGNDVTNSSTRKNLTYDRTVPEVTVKGDSVGTDGHYSLINLSLHDNFELSSAIVNGVEYKRGNKWNDLNFQNVNNYVEGENTIVLKDKAGNESTFTFVYDTTVPSYNFVGIMNIDQKTEGYAKVGDRVWVYVVINEHLSQEPTITINGVKAKIVQTEDGARFDADWYKYVAEVAMTEEMAEGEIKFTINGYKDLAGNQGLELTNANINKGLESIKLDKTAPKITVTNGSVGSEVYSKLNIQIFDANTVAKVVINGKELPHTGKYVDINDGHAYTFVDGENIVEVTDKAGNVTTKTFVVDKTAPTGTINYSTVNPTNKSVTVTLSTNEEVEILNAGTWDKQGFNTQFRKVYYANTVQNVTIKDKAGNISVVTVEIGNIDKVAPTAEVAVSEHRNDGKWVTFKFNEVIDESTLPQGMSKVTDEENTYKKVYYKSGTLAVKDIAGNEASINFEL